MARLRTVATACAISLLAACVTTHVKVTYQNEADVRKGHIDAISAVLTAKLSDLPKLLESRRRRLQPSADGLSYPAADVETLLSDLERPLRDALAGDDVAPLRDLIADRFAQARKELSLPRAAAGPRQDVRLAALRWAGEPSPATRTVDRAATDSAVERLRLLIVHLLTLSADRDLAFNLCVVSQPTGAAFRMSAPSLPGNPYSTSTTGSLINVSRGLYAYEARQGARSIPCSAPRPGDDWTCSAIDLWDDPRPVLDCDFSQGTCKRRINRKGECEEMKP